MSGNFETRARSTGFLSSRATRSPVQYLLVLLILGLVWRALFIYQDPEWLTNFWLFQDFGYSLKIAKNISMGLGETFDGVVPTNGYQPLYVWLMVPVFWIFKNDLLWPMYIAATLLALANVITGALIYSIVRRVTGQVAFALLGTAFWMFNLAVVKDGTNGLESGLSTMMVSASLYYYLKYHDPAMRLWQALFLGFLLGFSFLARVDAVFLAVAVFLGMLCDRNIGWKKNIVLIMIALLGFIAVAFPYAMWNLVHFGSPLPTSEQVRSGTKSLFSLAGTPFSELVSQFQYGCYIIFRMLSGMPSVNGWVAPPSGANAAVATAVVVVLVAGCGALLMWKKFQLNSVHKAALVSMFAAVLYTYGYTIQNFFSFERFFLPVILAITILVSLAACSLAGSAQRATKMRWVIVLSGLSVIYFINAGVAYWVNPGEKPIGWYAGIRRLNEISSPGDVVAAMQSGNTGYFYRNGRTINLDGAVNLETYKSRQQGQLDSYLRAHNVKYIADENSFIVDYGGMPNSLVNSLGDPIRRDRLLASLLLRYRSLDSYYQVYELMPDVYTTVRKLDGPGWNRREKTGLLGGYASFAGTPGARLDFSSTGCFALKFLKHSWSGIVDVLKDDVPVAKIDLFAPREDETYRMEFKQDGLPHKYSMVVSSEKNAQSQGHEVWFDAVLDEPSCKAAATVGSR